MSIPIKDTTTLMPEVQIHEWSFRLGAFPKIPLVRQRVFAHGSNLEMPHSLLNALSTRVHPESATCRIPSSIWRVVSRPASVPLMW